MTDETTQPEQPQDESAAETPAAAEQPAAADEASTADAGQPAATESEPAAAPVAEAADEQEPEDEEPPAPREKPAIPGMDLDPDLVLEDDRDHGDRWSEDVDPHAEEETVDEEQDLQEPITAEIQLSADARYRATGKRKTAIARVTLKPGTGIYTINGRVLADFFPRETLQRTIRQPLETVGYEDKVDVIARMHGGGVSAQAGALRHGISRALLEADPNLRTELKRRGFLTRDARAKERKKAGLKKARKRPQFSKR